MCYGLTQDEEAINDAVQELMLYYLQMNPDTLKGIWEKDGQEGLIRYGAVVLRRSLTSARSPFYYKYKKYYTHISNYYDWLMIIPINLSVATNGFFAGLETKGNSPIIRSYKIILDELVHEVANKIDNLKVQHE